MISLTVNGSGRRAGAPPLVRGPEAAEYPLSFGQERLWILDRFEPGNPAYNLAAGERLEGPLRPEVLARLRAGLPPALGVATDTAVAALRASTAQSSATPGAV